MVQRSNACRLLVFSVLLITFVVIQEHQNVAITRLNFVLTSENDDDYDFTYSATETVESFVSMLDSNIRSVKQHYAEYLDSLQNSSYIPLGHSTRFVPWMNSTDYYYESVEELESRRWRFPSVSQRVKLYMSNWYQPPCASNRDGHVQYMYLVRSHATVSDKTTVLLRPIVLSSSPISMMLKNNTLVANPITKASFSSSIISVDTTYSRDPSFFLYERDVLAKQCKDKLCLDAEKYFIPYVDAFFQETLDVFNDTGAIDLVPLLLQHGDSKWHSAKIVFPHIESDKINASETQFYQYRANVPILKKFRASFSKRDIKSLWAQVSSACFTNNEQDRWLPPSSLKELQPIVSIVSNFGRHFNPLNDVILADRLSWEEKLPQAIFRGGYTGLTDASLTIPPPSMLSEASPEYVRCQQTPRCRLVYSSFNSTILDAKLTHTERRLKNTTTIDGVPVTGSILSMDELLRFKGIIVVEGNDVASGLKWALFSNSVVLTPSPPRFTSWAMEELLEPWVHYIPLQQDLSDVEEKVQWMIDHDAEARDIARRGHLWMTDLMFHPNSMRDHEAVLEETMRRYRAHFLHAPTLLQPYQVHRS